VFFSSQLADYLAHAVVSINRHADRLLFGRDDDLQKRHMFLRTLALQALEKVYWRDAERLVAPPFLSRPSCLGLGGSGCTERPGYHDHEPAVDGPSVIPKRAR
jgi:hypothetical protein